MLGKWWGLEKKLGTKFPPIKLLFKIARAVLILSNDNSDVNYSVEKLVENKERCGRTACLEGGQNVGRVEIDERVVVVGRVGWGGGRYLVCTAKLPHLLSAAVPVV